MAQQQPPTQARHFTVNFITGNANKLSEVKAILENDLNLEEPAAAPAAPAAAIIRVESRALDLVEIQGTLEEVTIDKCRRAAELVRFLFYFNYFLFLIITRIYSSAAFAFFALDLSLTYPDFFPSLRLSASSAHFTYLSSFALLPLTTFLFISIALSFSLLSFTTKRA